MLCEEQSEDVKDVVEYLAVADDDVAINAIVAYLVIREFDICSLVEMFDDCEEEERERTAAGPTAELLANDPPPAA